jgi:K+-transporting ATPase ATPase B chain
VLATGADPFAAATAAAEAGFDELLAEATPESELDLILAHQSAGRLVATTGGALCDAPALAQADVGFATSACHEAAREAANLIAADPAPAKLADAVAVGRGLAAGRRRHAAFATAADLAKCLAVLPVVLAPVWPVLGRLDLLRLASPRSAVLAAVAFNSASALCLAPLARRASVPRRQAAPGRLDLAACAAGGVAAALAGLAALGFALHALGVA